MSYINFSITHRTPALASTLETVSAGFSREGGRLDLLEKTTSSHGPLPPITQRLVPDAALEAAGSGVLDAIRGASWVQDVVVEHGDPRQPAQVSWTFRDGSTGAAASNALPPRMQSVLDAARILEDAVTAHLTAN